MTSSVLGMTFSVASPNSSRRAVREMGSPSPANAISSLEHLAGRGSEFCLTLTPGPREDLFELVMRLSTWLKDLEATVLKLSVFGRVGAFAAGTEALRRVFGRPDWPMNWVEGASCEDHPIAGLQVIAINGNDVKRIELHGRVVGSVFEDGMSQHCLLAGMLPLNPLASQAEQTRQALANLEAGLADAGFSLADVVRTWFFNHQLLSWYRDFNQVRTALYSRTRFHCGTLPASTGVAGCNPAGAALTLDAWATKPLTSNARIAEIPSPMQCPAPAYGSSFSRAMEIVSAGVRRVLVSGTASITPDGRTAHAGDAAAQIALTMDVVKAILASRHLSFADVSRATAYFKSAADAPKFAEWLARRELRSLPVVSVCCDICRDDLLFELELDAWKEG